MYSLNIPVSALRTKVRQEFERHRYVNQLPVVDMLLFQSHAEYQVRRNTPSQMKSYMNWDGRPSRREAAHHAHKRAEGMKMLWVVFDFTGAFRPMRSLKDRLADTRCPL